MRRKISDRELFFAWRTLFYESRNRIMSIRESAKELSAILNIVISEDRLRDVIKALGTHLRQEAIEEHAPENYEENYDWAIRFAKDMSKDYRIGYRYVRKHIDRVIAWAKKITIKQPKY